MEGASGPRRLWAGAWLTGLLLLALPVTVHGQVATTRGEGIPWSRFILYPALSIEYEFDDNVLYQSADDPNNAPVEAGATLVRPLIVMDMPFGASNVRWSYAAQIRNYTNEVVQGSDTSSDFFDLEGVFREGRAFSARVKDHYVSDTVEIGQVTGSPELFGLVPFTLHAPEVEMAFQVGARNGVALFGRSEIVEFHDTGPSGFYDYDRRGIEARFNHRVSAPTVFYGSVAYEDTVQSRDATADGQVDVTDRRVGVGLTRTVNQAVVTRFVGGYQTLDFVGGGDGNFAGLFVSGNGSFRLGDTSIAEIGIQHQPYQSFYFNNNYYVSNELRVRFLKQVGRGFLWSAAGIYGTSSYSDLLDCDLPCLSDGKRRHDKYLRLELSAAYQFAPRMRVAVGYNYERRQTNLEQLTPAGAVIDPYHYEINRIFLRLEAGWL